MPFKGSSLAGPLHSPAGWQGAGMFQRKRGVVRRVSWLRFLALVSEISEENQTEGLLGKSILRLKRSWQFR